MKNCPFCAEEIQDEAIKCKHCKSMLTGDAKPPPTPSQTAVQFSHSGTRYLLGWGQTFYGIWDRQAPATPVRSFPRTDQGWREAWLAYVAWEPNNVEVRL